MKTAIRLVSTLLLGVVLTVHAQDFGDTPYVQTPQNVVDSMLEVAKVNANDYVIDLGSGDGRMVITAAKRYGARGFGVDLDKRLVTLSNRRAAQAGVAERAKFYAQDLHETDLSRASVVTIYLLPEVNLMVRSRLLALKPGTRIVSHDYDMGDWPPDVSFIMDAPGKPVGRDQKSRVFGWVVPSAVAGKWRWRGNLGGEQQDFDLELQQNFQIVTGTLTAGTQRVPVQDAKLEGDRLRFAATLSIGGQPVRHLFSGRVINHAIDGEVEGGGKAKWSAARTEVWQPAHVGAAPPSLDAFR